MPSLTSAKGGSESGRYGYPEIFEDAVAGLGSDALGAIPKEARSTRTVSPNAKRGRRMVVRMSLDFETLGGASPGFRLPCDHAGGVAGSESVVDVHHGHPGHAGIEHRQER